MKFKDFIPPILLKLRPKSAASDNCGIKTYKGFQNALSDSDTYQDPGIIETVSRKTRIFMDSLNSDRPVTARQSAQNMFILLYVNTQSGRAVDALELGGACGANYFELNHLLPGRIGNWHVVETPAMAVAGKKMFENNKIKFFSDIPEAAAALKNRDLVIAQGVLQYLPDPLETLGVLSGLAFKYVYITRTAVSCNAEKPVITKQVSWLSAHGPGKIPRGIKDRITSQPLTLLPYESIVRAISDGGYKILFHFDESICSLLVIDKRNVVTKDMGFLAAKREAL